MTFITESLEPRQLLAFSANIDFTTSSGPTASGYVADRGATYANRGNGLTYGWNVSNTSNARDRSAHPDTRYDTITHTQVGGSKSWNVAVPNGRYSVRLVAGDANYFNSTYRFNVETSLVAGTPTSSNKFVDRTVVVDVKDGNLSIANASGASNNKLAFLQITQTGNTPSNTGLADWPGSWRQSTNSPIARFEAYGFSYGNRLYTFGGFDDSSFDAVKRMDRFDPATGQWTYMGEMKAPETHAGLAVDESRGYAYFVSGYRGDYPSYPTKEVWRYDIRNNAWMRLPDFPEVGGGGTAAVVNGDLHYFGGSKPDRVTNTGLHYALDLSNTGAGWKRKADQPNSRDHMSAVVRNGEIYAVGGEYGHDRDSAHQRIFQKYNPNSNTWTRLADVPIAKSHAESSTFIHNNKLIFAGGQTYPKDSGTSNVVSYDFSTGRWSTIKSLPAVRQGVTVQRVGDVIVVANGGVRTDQPQRTVWIGELS
ncbi:MAG TPA: kelch repeat-containing protein [Tepidisphaeraceae bacterium]|jgi:N-acetylneuraminic acid mutarotase